MQFAMDEVDLPKIGLRRVGCNAATVLNGCAEMCIPANAESCNQLDLVAHGFAECVCSMSRNGYHRGGGLRGTRHLLHSFAHIDMFSARSIIVSVQKPVSRRWGSWLFSRVQPDGALATVPAGFCKRVGVNRSWLLVSASASVCRVQGSVRGPGPIMMFAMDASMSHAASA